MPGPGVVVNNQSHLHSWKGSLTSRHFPCSHVAQPAAKVLRLCLQLRVMKISYKKHKKEEKKGRRDALWFVWEAGRKHTSTAGKLSACYQVTIHDLFVTAVQEEAALPASTSPAVSCQPGFSVTPSSSLAQGFTALPPPLVTSVWPVEHGAKSPLPKGSRQILKQETAALHQKAADKLISPN